MSEKVGGNNINYVICCNGRSGSHLLFSLLKNTGIAGNGLCEKMHERHIEEAQIDWEKKDVKKFIEEIFESGRTPNGVSGFSLKGRQLRHFAHVLQRSKRHRGMSEEDILSCFPLLNIRYIWLTRKNKVEHAVSWLKAEQTAVWWVKRGEGEKGMRKNPIFDFGGIVGRMVEFERREKKWKKFFEKNGIFPLRIEYEEYVKDFKGTVVKILEYLGVPLPASLEISPDFLKQADAVSQDWVRKYHEISTGKKRYYCYVRCVKRVQSFFCLVSDEWERRSRLYGRFLRRLQQVKGTLRLSTVIAKAEIKSRNEGSYLGVLWYLLNPLLMFSLLLAVFSPRLGRDILQYPLYLLLGIIMFNFFQQATTESTRIIRHNDKLIKSVNFSKAALVAAMILKTLFSHACEMALFVLIALFFKVSVVGAIFPYFLILILFCLFCFGVSLILSALTVYFIDMENVWGFAVKLLWFATPVFYGTGGQSRLFLMNLSNPMYYFITAARDVVVYRHNPEPWVLAGAVFYSLLSLGVGVFTYNKLKAQFAEMI